MKNVQKRKLGATRESEEAILRDVMILEDVIFRDGEGAAQGRESLVARQTGMVKDRSQRAE